MNLFVRGNRLLSSSLIPFYSLSPSFQTPPPLHLIQQQQKPLINLSLFSSPPPSSITPLRFFSSHFPLRILADYPPPPSYHGHPEVAPPQEDRVPDLHPIHYACKWGDYETMKKYLSQSEGFEADVNLKTADGWTPLHYVSNQQNKDLLSLVLSYHPEINLQTKEGYTPLHCACSIGDIEMVELLISRNADLHVKSNNGWTPFHVACNNGHKNLVEYLLSLPDIDIHAKPKDYLSALYLACRSGYTEVADLLLSHNPNLISNVHSFFIACLRGQTETVKTLLEHGVYPHMTDTLNNSALHYTCMGIEGNKETIRLLLGLGVDSQFKNTLGYTPLHEICLKKKENGIVDALIRGGVDIDAQEKGGATALHFACQKGNLDAVTSLVSHNANINIQDENGWSPIHVACLEEHEEIVDFLLSHQPDLSTKESQDEWTPLVSAVKTNNKKIVASLLSQGDFSKMEGNLAFHVAACDGDLEMFSLLFSHCVDPNATVDHTGRTPLHNACRKGHKDIVKFLISKKNVDKDAKMIDGWNGLLMAADSGHKEIVEILLENGVDVSSRSNNGWNSLHIVAEMGHVEIIDALISHGIDMSAQTDGGWNALHIASKTGLTDVIKALLSAKMDIHAKSLSGKTALMYALEYEHRKAHELLQKH